MTADRFLQRFAIALIIGGACWCSRRPCYCRRNSVQGQYADCRWRHRRHSLSLRVQATRGNLSLTLSAAAMTCRASNSRRGSLSQASRRACAVPGDPRKYRPRAERPARWRGSSQRRRAASGRRGDYPGIGNPTRKNTAAFLCRNRQAVRPPADRRPQHRLPQSGSGISPRPMRSGSSTSSSTRPKVLPATRGARRWTNSPTRPSAV